MARANPTQTPQRPKGRGLRISLALLLVAFGAIILASAAQAAPYTGSGDWNIPDATVVNGGTVTVTGNVHVTAGGSLTLNSVTLVIASTYPGQYTLQIEPSASLVVRGGSIGPANPTNTFRFKIYGPALLDGVTVRNTWGSNTTYEFGIQIFDGNVTIVNSTIENGYRGNILIASGSPRLENNTIRRARHAFLDYTVRWTCQIEARWDAYGVYITNNSHPTLRNNVITENAYRGDWSDPWVSIYNLYYAPTSCGNYIQIYEMVLVDGVRVTGAGAEMTGDTINANGGFVSPGGQYLNYNASTVYIYRYPYDDTTGSLTPSAGLALRGASGNYTSLTITGNGQLGVALDSGSFVVEGAQISGHSQSGSMSAAIGAGSGGYIVNTTLMNNYYQVLFYGSGTSRIEAMTLVTMSVASASVIWTYYDASGSLQIYNSSIPSGLQSVIYAQSYNGATIQLYNLTNVTESQMQGYGTTIITIFWELGAQIVWSNGAPVSGAFLIITNQSSGTLFADVLDDTGATPTIWLPWKVITCTTWPSCSGTSTNSPLTIKVFANGTLSDPFEFTFNRSTFVRVEIRDPFPPSLNIFFPISGQRSNSSRLSLVGNVFDVGAGVDFVEFSSDAGNTWTPTVGLFPGWTGEQVLPDGLYTVWVRAWDRAGGHTDINITDLLIDTVAPVFEVLQPSIPLTGDKTLYTNATSVLLRGTAPGDATLLLNGGPLTVSGGTFNRQLILQEGANFYRLSANDPVGNTHEIEFVIFSDTMKPSVYVSSPPELFATNRSSINVAGVTESDVYLTLNGQPVEVIGGVFQRPYLLSEGLNILRIEASDRSGNTNIFTRTVLFDTVAPQIVVTAPTPGFQTNQRYIEIRGTVEAAIATVYIDGAPVPTTQGAFSRSVRLEEGLNQFRIQAWDSAGNPANANVQASLDVTPPDLAIQSPNYGALVATNNVRLRGTYSGASSVTISGVELILGDGIIDEQVALLEGTNTIVVHAQDEAGNGVDALVLVERDTVAPVLSVNLPSTPLQTRLEAFTINGAVEGATSLRVNGQPVAFGPTGNFTLVVALKAGTNTFTVLAEDQAGNQIETMHTIQRNIPPTPPQGLFGLGEASYALLPLMLAVGIAATFVIMRRGRTEP